MTRAMVIRTAGDAQIATALAEGMNAVELQRVRRECARLQAQVGVRRYCDDMRWERTRRRMAKKYAVKPVGRVRGAILGVWGLLWLGIDAAYRKLDAWNRGDKR